MEKWLIVTDELADDFVGVADSWEDALRIAAAHGRPAVVCGKTGVWSVDAENVTPYLDPLD